jgi:signal transduction histidine kinase
MSFSSIKHRKMIVLGLIVFVSAGCVFFIFLGHLRRQQKLPYHDSFAHNMAAEWIPYGGAWQLNDGAILNRSDELGAKLITGSSRWTDYQVLTDLKLVGHGGDVGVLVRVRNAERGTDSYNGYYIGLRSADSALVIGRADYGWMESRPVAIQGGIQSGIWYHLRVVAVGCNIGAEVTRVDTGQSSWAAFDEPLCVSSGKIGLRSLGTGGAWRNVEVLPAHLRDWQFIRAHAAFVGEPVYPFREADYDAMRENYFAENHIAPQGGLVAVNPLPAKTSASDVTPQIDSIASIRSMTSHTSQVTLRGVVTLISPLYVQDSTGGIAVKLNKPVALNLGDEVEIRGTPVFSTFSSRVDAASVRLLWDRTLVLPISVTSTQAATGAFDSSLIELRGILRSKTIGPDGLISLDLYDSAQSFRAIVRGGISMQKYARWSPGSRLRISGICLVTPSSGKDGATFTVLLRSMEDVEVFAGPPWWTGRKLHELLLAGFALFALGVFVYLRLERAKMRAILSERERLAHEMHDTLAQSFAGVGFHLQGLRNSMRSGSADLRSIMGKLDTACELVAHTHREASASIAALHPGEEEGRDLLVALERSARSMLDTGDFPFSFVKEGTPHTLSLLVRDALFQIGREAITNVLRHSNATHVALLLRYEPKSVILEVRDNGRGFKQSPQANGFGIRTMYRRAKEAGAQLIIETAPGAGTALTVIAPYGRQLTFMEWLRPQFATLRWRMDARLRLSRVIRSATEKS